MTTSDPLVGDVLDGRYEIVARLARGGMATVYRAQDRRLGRVVAIKVMQEQLDAEGDFARKFDREAKAAAQLCDSHVVSVFDQGEDRGRPYIVMEYVDGGTLRNVIVEQAPMAPQRALQLLEPVVQALAVAHAAGIVHRDVKPENVLISSTGQIKVTDFGLARALSNQTATATQGLLIGTVSYLPPELVLANHADPRSDVYSVGVVLFEMVTGRKPYTGEMPINVAYAHVNNDMPAPSSVRPGIPSWLDDLVLLCTRREPAQRPRDARELLDLIRQARKQLAKGLVPTAVTRPLDLLATPVEAPARPGLAAAALLPGDSGTAVDTPRVVPPAEPVTDPLPKGTGPGVRPAPAAQQPARTALLAELATEGALRRRRGIIWTVLILALAGLIGTTSWWFAAGRWTQTPVLTGLTEPQATQVATDAGLTVKFTPEYSETVPAGTVISTAPQAGERILHDGQIAATLSRGPERFAVPTLAGLTLTEAQEALARENLAPGQVVEAFSDQVTAGLIIKASQAAGAQVKRGTVVDLTISKGPEMLGVTDFTGKSVNEATQALTATGFTVKTVEQNSTSVASGTVIQQDPAGGELQRGGTVTLTVSSGPRIVTIPDGLIFKSMTSVRDTLQGLGLQVNVHYTTSEVLRVGVVTRVDPASGNQIAEGGVVTIDVA